MSSQMSKVAKLKAGAAAVNDDIQKPSNLPIKELCNNGDLVLLVGEDLGPVYRFRVSRNTLCMASPVWRAMLSGEFIESKLNEIPFADDEPEALLLVLRIAHLRFHEIPQQLPDEKLVEVATICDKYDTVAVCRPFIRDWIAPWIKSRRFMKEGNEGFLWIAWVFGYRREFTWLAWALQFSIHTDEAGNCRVKGKILDHNMPPDLVESLMQNRLATVKKLSAIYYAVFEKAEQGLSCMFADANEKNKECCHALTLGLLIRGFSPFGQCVLRPSASRIFQSLSEFHLALSAVKVFTWPDEKYGEGSHEGCNFGPQLVADLKAAYDSTKSLVLDSHRLHMKVQWMKGEPETMQTPDS